MVSIKNPSSASSSYTFSEANGSYSVLPRAISFCEIKQRWTDEWQFVPWLEPIDAVECCAPEVSHALVRYHYGEILRQQSSSADTYYPLQLRDWYVRISIQHPNQDPQPVWYGIFADDQPTMDGQQVSGAQDLRAFGFAHWMDRIELRTARVKEGTDIWETDWLPTFNRRHRVGRVGAKDILLEGNSSTDKGDDGVYVFSRDTRVWTNRDIVEYLVKYHWNDQIPLTVTGQVEELEQIEDVHEITGLSLWDALKRLIDRRHGLGFEVRVSDAGLELFIFTINDEDITFGEKTLGANPNKVDFTLPTEYPWTHLVGEIPFRTTSLSAYDQITVRSKERIKVMATFRYQDGNLEAGWTAELEEEYMAVADVDQAGEEDIYHARDRVRATERFDAVYARHRVPRDWDWTVYTQDAAQTGEPPISVAIYSAEDGTVVTPDDPDFSPYYHWNGQKRAFRDLPILSGVDYEVNPPEDLNPTGSDPQFASMLVYINLGVGDPPRRCELSRLHEANTDYPSCHVTPLDRDIGFQIGVNPGYLFGKNQFDTGGGLEGVRDPVLDYEDLQATMFFETDQKLRVVVKSDADPVDSARPTRELFIEVPGAEYWWAPKGTIIDIAPDGSGDLIAIADENRVIRNDAPKLRAIAARAKAWYLGRRQAVQIPLNDLGLYVEIGALLTSINSIYGTDPVRTPVTARRLDFTRGMTIIETGYHAIDLMVRPTATEAI